MFFITVSFNNFNFYQLTLAMCQQENCNYVKFIHKHCFQLPGVPNYKKKKNQYFQNLSTCLNKTKKKLLSTTNCFWSNCFFKFSLHERESIMSKTVTFKTFVLLDNWFVSLSEHYLITTSDFRNHVRGDKILLNTYFTLIHPLALGLDHNVQHFSIAGSIALKALWEEAGMAWHGPCSSCTSEFYTEPPFIHFLVMVGA